MLNRHIPLNQIRPAIIVERLGTLREVAPIPARKAKIAPKFLNNVCMEDDASIVERQDISHPNVPSLRVTSLVTIVPKRAILPGIAKNLGGLIDTICKGA